MAYFHLYAADRVDCCCSSTEPTDKHCNVPFQNLSNVDVGQTKFEGLGRTFSKVLWDGSNAFFGNIIQILSGIDTENLRERGSYRIIW